DDDQFGLKSMYNEFHVELSDDGLRAYLAATRDKSFGVDVFTASRPDTASSFGSLSALFAGTFDEHDPHVTGDELRIYYAIYQVNDQELWTATRASVNDPFGDAVPLDAVNLPGVIDANPSVSRDQRVLVFASMRSGEGDVYVSVRDEPDLPWGPPSLLPPGVNTMAAFDGEPFLAESTGKCELFFASDREAEGNHDLYRVDIEVTD
ncbi:MAG: hypothetical protein R3B09_29925, partial [Nannocystaceae bacterium]